MSKLIIIFILLFVSTCLHSQNRVIKGRVVSDQFDILIGVSININDTSEVGKSDMDGFSKIEIPVSEKRLFFGSVGLDPTSIVLNDKCDEVEVIMMLSATYDFISLRRVDRL